MCSGEGVHSLTGLASDALVSTSRLSVVARLKDSERKGCDGDDSADRRPDGGHLGGVS